MGLVTETACTVARLHQFGAGVAVMAIIALLGSLYETRREMRIMFVIFMLAGLFLTTFPLSLLE
jgi:hypothetical protein